jgi:L-iditol 2-dehydrogenase
LGHEFEGTVVAAGPGATMALGIRVAIDPNISCLKCRYCPTGLVSHCSSLHSIGVDRDGGLAQFATVPEQQAYELPPDLPMGYGTLCEPLACCLRASDHAAIGPGDRVAVLGGGVIGQLLAQLARLAGARVVLVTRQPTKRALAEALGASTTLSPDEDDVVEGISGPFGFAPGGVDVAFEAAGVGATFQQAVATVRHEGKVVIVGAAPISMTLPISPFDVFARDIQIIGSHLNPLTHGRAVSLAASGALELSPLITRTVDLDGAHEALAQGPPRATSRSTWHPAEQTTREKQYRACSFPTRRPEGRYPGNHSPGSRPWGSPHFREGRWPMRERPPHALPSRSRAQVRPDFWPEDRSQRCPRA